jgi:hypothetical protein
MTACARGQRGNTLTRWLSLPKPGENIAAKHPVLPEAAGALKIPVLNNVFNNIYSVFREWLFRFSAQSSTFAPAYPERRRDWTR